MRDAGHEVVEAGVAPELDLFGGKPADGGRIVERHDVAVSQTAADAETLRQRRRVTVAEARGAHRAEVRRRLVLEHQRHAIDQQRLDDARDQALGQAVQVEVAVEIAREPDSARR